jgi:mRNA-degrading endonuclease RelE of RelBE toxin-antitoxin system
MRAALALHGFFTERARKRSKLHDTGLPRLRSPRQLYWKHEFAARRVIYRIYEEKKLVVVCTVGPRKQGEAADVYKQFQTLAQTGKVARQIAEVLGSLARGKRKTEHPKR